MRGVSDSEVVKERWMRGCRMRIGHPIDVEIGSR